MTYASMSLANTGIDGQEYFVNLARSYSEQFYNYIHEKQRETDRKQTQRILQPSSSGLSEGGDVFSLSDMPIFQYHEEPLADALGRATVDVMLMGLLTIVCFAGAYVSFLKYDAR